MVKKSEKIFFYLFVVKQQNFFIFRKDTSNDVLRSLKFSNVGPNKFLRTPWHNINTQTNKLIFKAYAQKTTKQKQSIFLTSFFALKIASKAEKKIKKKRSVLFSVFFFVSNFFFLFIFRSFTPSLFWTSRSLLLVSFIALLLWLNGCVEGAKKQKLPFRFVFFFMLQTLLPAFSTST